MIWILANPNEDARPVEIPDGADTYAELVKLIGGYICDCPFYTTPGVTAWCHDEALLEGLPWNRRLGPRILIAGPIVVTGIDAAGETTGLTPEAAEEARGFLDSVPRLAPTPSSVEELEERTGVPAVQIIFGNGKE